MNEGMDLKEFVKSVMRDLTQAVSEHLGERDRGSHSNYEDDRSEMHARFGDVDFDVAVTTTSSQGSNAGGGIKVMNLLSAGGGKHQDASHESATRIKFTIHGIGIRKS